MKALRHTWLTLAILLPYFLLAQTPFPALPPVFKDDVIPRVDILLPPDSLNILLAPGNEESNYHWHATFIFDNGEMKDTVENVGFRLRGNTSRQAEKKSFKVSFNTYEPGRKWAGLEKLNLNGEHNDPAVARSKICWDLLRRMEVPAPRANHVEFYVNGNFFGLYINVEHIDEEFVQLRFGNNDGNLFKCLWPADLVYKGSNPDLYKEEFGGRRAYELTINEDEDDYSDLANFIDILNNTPLAELPCELEQVFNVDGFLRAAAFDILSGNWDGPIFNKNNFYLYHNEANGKFEYIPYDLDNTFGIDWFNIDWASRDIYNWASGEPRPIYKRLLMVPEYRDRFSFYLNKFIGEIFNSTFFTYLDDLRTMISPSAQADPYRPLDYGFTFAQFQSSFETGLPFFHTPVGLKEFVNERKASALSQLQLNNIAPIVTGVSNNFPNSLQDISITAKGEDDGSIASMEVCYQLNGQNLTCVPMYDDGQHADGSAGDKLFGALIPPLNETALLEYFVQASDNTGKQSRQPVCGFENIYIGNTAVPLVVNEIMASNNTTFADEAGEFDDWLEIFSLSDVPIYLGNYYLSDDQGTPDKWQMPDLWIQPGEHLVFWADNDEDQGLFHTNFKLSAGGEFAGIFADAANNFALIDGIDFPLQESDKAYGRLPNGTGPFQLVEATPGAENLYPLSADDVESEAFGVKIYPNPFGEILKTEWQAPSTASTIRLHNAVGTVIFEEKNLGQNNASLHTGHLPQGFYFIEIKMNDGKAIIKKVLLQR